MAGTTHHTSSACRALVAIEPATRPRRKTLRPCSAFVAQLIAVRMQAPQTRAQRRASPAEVTDRYRAALAGPPPAAGTAFAVTLK